jgi:uncharacterized membrane protein YfcA
MDINSTLIMAILFSFLIGFVFSMFGQGGGSVYSPLLILLSYSVLISSSTSLVLNLITSTSAGYIFYKNKMIDMKASLAFVPGIVVGAFAGGLYSKSVNTTILLWLFVLFLVAVGARMLYSYWEKPKAEDKYPSNLSAATYALIVVFSIVVGIISGLLGVGGGILVVPFMTNVLKYPTKSAAGSSHLIISFSALAGIIGHAASHRLDIPLIVATGVAVLLAGNLGARFSLRVKPRMIKAGLGLLMWALSAQILLKLLRIV